MTHAQTPTPATDPASPHYVPFYARPEHAPEWEAFRSFLERFGTPLICPRAACARAGRCGDEARQRLPFCFTHYRGLLRFVMMAAQAAGRPLGAGRPEGGPSFLGVLAAGGLDLDALRRPLDAGEDRSCFETEDGGHEAFERLVALMGGRPPAGRAALSGRETPAATGGRSPSGRRARRDARSPRSRGRSSSPA